MYKRYHIETSPIKLLSTEIGKFKIIRNSNCLNCGQCITWCIYNVHKRDPDDPRKMFEPVSYLCKNCFSCIQNCPQHTLIMVNNDEYENLGNSYWTPQIIYTIWNEAEEGKIPVYGAGYRGPFKGSGFDNIWTDMSEIVRPTRDGIHGREYIATAVDIGRKLAWINDFERLTLPKFCEIQVPILFDTNPLELNAKNIILSIVKAAHRLGTLAYLDVENYCDELKLYLKSMALRCHLEKISHIDSVPWKEMSLIEIVLPSQFSILELELALKKLNNTNSSPLISLGITNPCVSKEIIQQFLNEKADVVSFCADNQGKNLAEDTFISESIRKLHLEFVKNRLRDEITILGRGGIAAAEHVPKLIICGADAVVLDLSLLVAMGCRVCEACQPQYCPIEIKELDSEIATQRVINMICAWREQLLEILSAMGMRDVRRLRGEVGRAIFYEEIEKESFEFFSGEKVSSK